MSIYSNFSKFVFQGAEAKTSKSGKYNAFLTFASYYEKDGVVKINQYPENYIFFPENRLVSEFNVEEPEKKFNNVIYAKTVSLLTELFNAGLQVARSQEFKGLDDNSKVELYASIRELANTKAKENYQKAVTDLPSGSFQSKQDLVDYQVAIINNAFESYMEASEATNNDFPMYCLVKKVNKQTRDEDGNLVDVVNPETGEVKQINKLVGFLDNKKPANNGNSYPAYTFGLDCYQGFQNAETVTISVKLEPVVQPKPDNKASFDNSDNNLPF